MSDYRAIAGATRTLLEMLKPAARQAIPGISVGFTFGSPQAHPHILHEATINIFMFQIYPNPDFRNRDLPTRASDGSLIERPAAAIDLDYLITFFEGKTATHDKLYSQQLLGAVVSALHAEPTPRAEHVPSEPDAGGLVAERELIRFTPTRLSRDDMSKLWSVHHQVPYQLSVVYRCSVLLIEPMPLVDETNTVVETWVPKPSLPSGGPPSTSPQPGMPPELESISPQRVAYESGKEIVIRGRSLGGKPLAVQVGKSETEPATSGPSGLTFLLPADAPAGVHPVRVLLGPKDGTRVDSNSLPLVVQPHIQGEPQVIDRSSGRDQERIALVMISPVVQPGQKVELLLNSLPKASRKAPAYRLRGASSDKARSLVEVPISEVKKGKYLMRIEVDGATSSLTQAADGTFDGPHWEVK